MHAVSEKAVDEPTLADLLDLEEIDRDLYRANLVFDDPLPLYGGQVAAQALAAAGRTVAEDRLPHSLHGYFLRPGDATRPTIFHVDRDRDGGSYSARRVVAVQNGEVIFNMSASFHRREEGVDREAHPERPEGDPEQLPGGGMPRLFSMQGALPPQPYPDGQWPTRFWARCKLELPDNPLIHACVLTYLSDISSGVAAFGNEEASASSSLDHAVWFHRPGRLDDWVHMDLVPQSVAGGRGWYTGTVRTRDGVLLASLAQECLFRNRRR
ncbi:MULTISPECIES: acyl-CoA thioesterase II [Amycolatopsis]|uniref:Acyl-CoA thioesterase II n=1 Tax=Amycolatopsis tucumanensis TaxID=401106 RepID=A0ABP7IA52_9PSEU|nr:MULTISPECIES: acyl-CoA thioesterase domain-containing protein [Amycolatopsis]MCF6428832.1 thioesterase family protein [Amycolatopsis tucumanensis]